MYVQAGMDFTLCGIEVGDTLVAPLPLYQKRPPDGLKNCLFEGLPASRLWKNFGITPHAMHRVGRSPLVKLLRCWVPELTRLSREASFLPRHSRSIIHARGPRQRGFELDDARPLRQARSEAMTATQRSEASGHCIFLSVTAFVYVDRAGFACLRGGPRVLFR